MRENLLLKEIDDVVTRARQEVTEKKGTIQELYTAKVGLERDLTKNKLREVLTMHQRLLDDEIRSEISVGWVVLDWEKEQLEQSDIRVCKVVNLKERPITEKWFPVWSRDGTDSKEVISPYQLAIDDTTQNIFVTDNASNKIQVFNGEGNHLFKISIPPHLVGIALTDKHIFVSNEDTIVKLQMSNNETIKSVKTENKVWGLDIHRNTNLYGCELNNQSVILFDKDLRFMKRIKLETTLVKPDTQTPSIILYENTMYVMFSPPSYLQIFTLEGNIIGRLINILGSSHFFSIDHLGNIIVANWGHNVIKIFSKEGVSLHTITKDMLPGDQTVFRPRGVAVDKNNRIIVAQQNKQCNLLAFSN